MVTVLPVPVGPVARKLSPDCAWNSMKNYSRMVSGVLTITTCSPLLSISLILPSSCVSDLRRILPLTSRGTQLVHISAEYCKSKTYVLSNVSACVNSCVSAPVHRLDVHGVTQFIGCGRFILRELARTTVWPPLLLGVLQFGYYYYAPFRLLGFRFRLRLVLLLMPPVAALVLFCYCYCNYYYYCCYRN